MAFPTAFHLRLRLRQMSVYRSLVFMCNLCHPFHQLSGTGILRMKSDKITEQRIVMVQRLIALLQQFQGRLKIRLPARSADLYAAHSHIHTGLRRRLRRQIHIKDGCDTAGQILQYRQLRQVIDHLPVHLILYGKDLLEQPVLQRQVVRIRTQKRHTGMSMSILETGHQQIAPAVDLPVPSALTILCTLAGGTDTVRITAVTDIQDLSVLHP